jgi:hypothetical protein
MLFHGLLVHPENIPLAKPGLYRITNQINGKPYIGATRNLATRPQGHGKKSPPKLRAAITKYGKFNFLFEPMFYCIVDDIEFLLLCEAHMIALSDRIRRGAAKMTPEARSQRARENYGSLTHEQRVENGRKSHATRLTRGNHLSAKGTIWINDGSVNRRIASMLPLPDGWVLGNIQKRTRARPALSAGIP